MDDDDGEIREILSDFILGQIISHLISSHLISSLSLSLQLCVLSRSLSVFFFQTASPRFCGVRQENWEK